MLESDSSYAFLIRLWEEASLSPYEQPTAKNNEKCVYTQTCRGHWLLECKDGFHKTKHSAVLLRAFNSSKELLHSMSC